MNRRQFLGAGFAGMLATTQQSTAAYLEETRFDIAHLLERKLEEGLYFPGIELLRAQSLELWNTGADRSSVDAIINTEEGPKYTQFILEPNQQWSENLYDLHGVSDVLVFRKRQLAASIVASDPSEEKFLGVIQPNRDLATPHINASTYGLFDFNFLPSRNKSSVHHLPIHPGLERMLGYSAIVDNDTDEYIRMKIISRSSDGKIFTENENYVPPRSKHVCAPISMAPSLQEGSLTIETTSRSGEPLLCDILLQFNRSYFNTRHTTTLTDEDLGVDLAVRMHHKPKGYVDDATQVFVTHVPHQYGLTYQPVVNVFAALVENNTSKSLVANYAMPMLAGTTKRVLLSDLAKMPGKNIMKGDEKKFDYKNARGYVRFWMPSYNGHNPLGRIGTTVLSTTHLRRDPTLIDAVRYATTAQVL